MNNDNLVIDTRADISEGCPMSCGVDGGNMAHVLFGEGHKAVELVFDMASLRALVEAGGKAVAEMYTRSAEQEVRDDATPP